MPFDVEGFKVSGVVDPNCLLCLEPGTVQYVLTSDQAGVGVGDKQDQRVGEGANTSHGKPHTKECSIGSRKTEDPPHSSCLDVQTPPDGWRPLSFHGFQENDLCNMTHLGLFLKLAQQKAWLLDAKSRKAFSARMFWHNRTFVAIM